ncbi:MAG: aldehyde ferredoxin oxidoreductase family protein [Nanopusillaceae archaeon]
MEYYGYTGKILRVNLTTKRISVEEIDENILKKWIGGRGLGVYYFIKEVNPKINPLSDENKIIISSGPLTGIAGAPTPGRIVVVSKSPLTNRLGWSVGGGKFGPYLKFSGYDAIIIEGKSEEPVYISIIDGNIEINSAKDIWGKDVVESYNYLLNKCPGSSILLIGPAGENLVKYASINIERYHAAGRLGFGAVFGSKKLKGIVVKGNNKLKIYNEGEFRKIMGEKLVKLRQNELVQDLSKYGTLGMLITRIGKHNAIPSNNFNQYMKIDAEKIKNDFLERIDIKESPKEACWGCQIGCHKYIRTKIKELYAEGGAPEYWGGFVSLGSSLGIDDTDFIIYVKNLTDKLGLDTISTGHVISSFIELVQNKRINYDIKWGDKEKIIELIRKIVYREDIGNELAEGSVYLANKYGNPKVSVSIKGLEIGLCHPGSAIGYRLALATSNRGDHNQTMLRDEILLNKLDPEKKEGKVDYVIHMQNLFAIIDSLGICIFSSYALDFEDLLEYYNAITGFNLSLEEFKKAAERIYTAERYFNVLSLGYEEDKLPSKFNYDISDLLKEYYEKRGWENGIPKKEKLKELKII